MNCSECEQIIDAPDDKPYRLSGGRIQHLKADRLYGVYVSFDCVNHGKIDSDADIDLCTFCRNALLIRAVERHKGFYKYKPESLDALPANILIRIINEQSEQINTLQTQEIQMREAWKS